MIRFAFNPSDGARKRLAMLKKGGSTYAFSDLFKPVSINPNDAGDHRKFGFESEILELFQVIDGSKRDDSLLSFLDYDKLKKGMMCRHIVCVLPYCASCDALAELLSQNKSLFKNLGEYEILNISGHDMPRELNKTGAVVDRIREVEGREGKTITLTVNRMLTGSTVPEWDTMLYFKDTSSPQEYDQAVFRLQNQYVVDMPANDDSGKLVRYNKKPQTLLVDFDPERLFRMQETKSKIYNFNTDAAGNSKLRERIAEELRVSPVVRANLGRLARVEPADIMAAVRDYSRNRGVSDEANDVEVDVAGLAQSDWLLAVINSEDEIGHAKGFFAKPFDGDETELDVPEDMKDAILDPAAGREERDPDAPEGRKEKDSYKSIAAKLRTYYARILFFAFLTKDAVRSLEDIIKVVDRANNKRIARNVGISRKVLKEMQKVFSKPAVSALDYKIENMSDLARDGSVEPLERARTMLKKFDRFGPSEIVTPERIADDMVALLPDDEFCKILDSRKKFLDIAGKMGEFAVAIYKRAKKLRPGIDLSQRIATIPTSGHAYEFTRKVYESLGMNVANIATFTAYDLHKALGKKPSESDFRRVADIISQKKPFWKITMNDTISSRKCKSPFALVIGNPPYQEETAKRQSETNGQVVRKSIFQDFQRLADAISTEATTFIYPGGRWIHRSGKGMDDFGAEQINDPRLAIVHYWPDWKDLFTAAQIADGISIVQKIASKTSPGFKYVFHKNAACKEFEMAAPGEDLIPLDPDDLSILAKVRNFCEKHSLGRLSSRILPRSLFGIESDFVEKNPEAVRPYSCDSEIDFSREIKLFTNDRAGKAGRAKWYIADSSVIKSNQAIAGKWKVVVSSANAGGQKRDWQLEIMDNHSAFGRSRVALGIFDTKVEAENFCAYCASPLIRFLFLMTDEALTSLAKEVPDIGDYSAEDGIIDFAGDIERQLITVFGLSADEAMHAEKKVADKDASRSSHSLDNPDS